MAYTSRAAVQSQISFSKRSVRALEPLVVSTVEELIVRV